MAYGQFQGYESGPAPGTFAFLGPNGQRWTFAGPQAEELKRRIDASASVQPKLAQNMSLPEEANMSVPEQAVDVGQPLVSQGQPDTAGIGPTVEAAAAAEAERQATDPLAGFEPSHTTATGDVVMVNKQTGQVVVNARARRGSRGGLVERTRTVKGGFEADPEYLEETGKNFERQLQSEMMGAEAAAEQAAYERGALVQQRKALAEAQAEEEARINQVSTRVQELQRKYDAAEQNYLNSAPDPMAERDNTKDSIIRAVAAFGAYLNNKPEQIEMVNRAIDQEIARSMAKQEAMHRVAKDDQNSSLAKLEKELGSLGLARKALESIELKRHQNAFELIANTTGDQQKKAAALSMAANLNQKWLDKQQEYLRSAEGEVTRSLVNTPGTAGSRGGVRLATAGELKDTRGLQSTEAGITSTTVNTAKNLRELEQPGGAGNSGQTAQRQLADLESAKQSLLRLKLYHKQQGEPGVLRTGYGATDSSQRLAAEVEAMAPGLGRALEGNAPNESTMDAIRGGLLSASGDRLSTNIDAYLQQIEDRKRALLANPPPDEPAQGAER